jgi:hypothetical protein
MLMEEHIALRPCCFVNPIFLATTPGVFIYTKYDTVRLASNRFMAISADGCHACRVSILILVTGAYADFKKGKGI